MATTNTDPLFASGRCAVCARSLRDALSVELGIGPVCRKKHGYYCDEITEENRSQANKLVWVCSVHVDDEEIRAVACAELRLLGFGKLATRIEYRGSDAAKASVKIIEHAIPGRYVGSNWYPAVQGVLVTTPYNEEANYAWRRIGGRQWLSTEKANFVPNRCKKGLWQLLKTYYTGHTGNGPRGNFQIQ